MKEIQTEKVVIYPRLCFDNMTLESCCMWLNKWISRQTMDKHRDTFVSLMSY